MPPRRKIYGLPPEERQWLEDELRATNYSDYVRVAAELNRRLEARGDEERVQKSAVHAYGQELREFARLQNEAGAWAKNWVAENSPEGDAERQQVLFQMATTLAFKHMAGQMGKDADDIAPKDLHFLARMMKDIMSSSVMREKMIADAREQAVAEDRQAQAAKISAAEDRGLLDKDAARKAREIMGFA